MSICIKKEFSISSLISGFYIRNTQAVVTQKTNTYIYEDSCGNEHTKVHTKWTQKGRLFIYSLLKADGIFPQIEMEG